MRARRFGRAAQWPRTDGDPAHPPAVAPPSTEGDPPHPGAVPALAVGDLIRPGGGPARARGDVGRLLRRPGYVGFALTVTLTRISSTMFTAGGVLFVLSRTGSPAVAGATAAAAVLPAAITGPVLGAWLDRSEHRRVLIVADQLASVTALVALLLLAGHAPDWTLPIAAVLYSVTRPFTQGGFFSALTEIAGPELLDEAGRIESVSLNLAFVIGPALAGLIAGAAGAPVAIEVQIAGTLLAGALIAGNPAFEIGGERATSTRHALSSGLRALASERMLRAPGLASLLAAFGWGLMNLGFPLYAVHTLHAGTHATGYMWAAVAGGSLVGTFALSGPSTLRRIGGSYAALGISALLWPLAHALVVGVALIGFTGFLEGPAYSGTVSLRSRHAPAAVRAQVVTTLTGANLVAVSAGAVIAGAVGSAPVVIIAFTAVNLLAALAAWAG
jgi:hypothetical protein